MDQRAMAARQFAKNQVKKVTDYFKPTEKVRVRDFVREVPGAVGQVFSGTRDTVVKGGKILGEGLAYATSPNVRKMYQAGNTDILPTVSNTTPRQILGNTAKSAFEIAPVGKIRGLANAAMSSKLAPRMIAGGAMGYGYDVADRFSRPEPISQSTFNPGISTLAGALFGGMSKPTAQMIGKAGREIGDDIRNLNPANRLSHRVVDKYDMEPVPGVFAPGGIQQQRPSMESFRKEVETTQRPYEPQSYLARVLMGKQSPVGNTIQAVDDPLLREARKAPSVIRGGDEYGKTAIGEVSADNMVARERFNIPSLKKISFGGSDRDVYDIGDGNVLKVVKTARGITQNVSSSDYYAENAGLIPKTIEVGKNYIVKEKVLPPDAQTKAMVRDIQKLLPYDKQSNEYYTALETLRAKYEDVFPFDDLQNYDILDGDLKALRNWGTTKDGNPVILDEGTLNGNLVKDHKTGGRNLDDPEFRDIYNQSRAAKKKFGDTDKKTMYGIAALLGLGGLNQSQEQ